ncbi:DNA/RNA non-specific endonuclease [Sphingomonas azotifigens]|uniref:DNA/RNA non-specific endonuclease n=1 Tax=Sphingomonas azotifigens TaxID=330920 RepID=UPI001FE9F470|nr:DNA/RNA non-specific endonuclease [Sphingomonas azotifigens]
MQTGTEQRRAFTIWLRTGRRVRLDEGGAIEVKFNPWHDPSDGRFTFAGTGSTSKGGAGVAGQRKRKRVPPYGDDPKLKPIASLEEADAWRASELAKHPGDPDWREAIEVRYRYYQDHFRPLPPPLSLAQRGAFVGGGGRFGGGGASGSWGEPPIANDASIGYLGGGGSFGGGGASGSWEAPSVDKRSADTQRYRASTDLDNQPDQPTWRHVFRNGYDYEIDERERTRRVSGVLVLAPPQPRSRSLQRSAGGTDRLPKDDGGHYIAPRFNGPTAAFNHFAQDANVNRGRYRVMEDEWARKKRAGHRVTVTIVPHFRATSQRPKAIDVIYTVDADVHSVKLPNERGGRHHGR